MTTTAHKKTHASQPAHDASSDSGSEDASSVDEHVHTEDCTHAHTGTVPDGADAKLALNRNEKKARKIFGKLGLKPVPGIERVTIKRSKNTIFAIANPEVFKSPVSDCYIVFGEAKIEDPAMQAQAMAAQRLAAARQNDDESEATYGEEARGGVKVVGEQNEDGDGGEEADVTGLDEKDVKIVMEQANVSRAKAIKALRENEGDIVNTIMNLTI